MHVFRRTMRTPILFLRMAFLVAALQLPKGLLLLGPELMRGVAPNQTVPPADEKSTSLGPRYIVCTFGLATETAMAKPTASSNDRKAGHGSTAGAMTGSPKGGHGKGGWGAVGDDRPAPLDPRDPCFPED